MKVLQIKLKFVISSRARVGNKWTVLGRQLVWKRATQITDTVVNEQILHPNRQDWLHRSCHWADTCQPLSDSIVTGYIPVSVACRTRRTRDTDGHCSNLTFGQYFCQTITEAEKKATQHWQWTTLRLQGKSDGWWLKANNGFSRKSAYPLHYYHILYFLENKLMCLYSNPTSITLNPIWNFEMQKLLNRPKVKGIFKKSLSSIHPNGDERDWNISLDFWRHHSSDKKNCCVLLVADQCSKKGSVFS